LLEKIYLLYKFLIAGFDILARLSEPESFTKGLRSRVFNQVSILLAVHPVTPIPTGKPKMLLYYDLASIYLCPYLYVLVPCTVSDHSHVILVFTRVC